MTKLSIQQRLTRSKIRVKIKSLGEEVRIIRHEERAFRKQSTDPGHRAASSVLYEHRKNHVSPEIRAAHWAYAYLQGRPYSDIEKSTKTDRVTLSSLERRASDIVYSLARKATGETDIRRWRLAESVLEDKAMSA